MINQTSKGDAISVAAPTGGGVAGNGYLLGSLFGVSPVTATAGVQIALWLVGVYTLVKSSGEASTVGQLIYWDNTNKRCTTNSTSDTRSAFVGEPIRHRYRASERCGRHLAHNNGGPDWSRRLSR